LAVMMSSVSLIMLMSRFPCELMSDLVEFSARLFCVWKLFYMFSVWQDHEPSRGEQRLSKQLTTKVFRYRRLEQAR
jgi:hypothetical protein